MKYIFSKHQAIITRIPRVLVGLALVLMLFLILLPLRLLAAEQGNVVQSSTIATDPMSSSYLAQLVVGLIVVLVCIVGLAWLAKRFNSFQSAASSSLKVLGGISMGARERIVLVQIGSTQLLLGVAPGRVSKLHVLDEKLEDMEHSTGAGSNQQFSKQGFAEKLSSVISKGKQ